MRQRSLRREAGRGVNAGLGPLAADHERDVRAVELALPGAELPVGLGQIALGRGPIDIAGDLGLVDQNQHPIVGVGGVAGGRQRGDLQEPLSHRDHAGVIRRQWAAARVDAAGRAPGTSH